jgi:hypothetical protein
VPRTGFGAGSEGVFISGIDALSSTFAGVRLGGAGNSMLRAGLAIAVSISRAFGAGLFMGAIGGLAIAGAGTGSGRRLKLTI